MTKEIKFTIAIIVLSIFSSNLILAQDAVTPAKDVEQLFTSTNKKYHKNKQVAYHIVKDLLESNHWELADKYIDSNYIQHNPNARNGRDAVIYYFTQIMKVQPTPIPEKTKMKVVSVLAEGDLVVVSYAIEEKDPKDPTKTYTTTWFDQWLIKDGKALEHWDCALKMH